METTNSRSEFACRLLSSDSPARASVGTRPTVNVALMNSLTDLPCSVPSVKSSIPAFLSFASLFRREFLLFRTRPRFCPPGSTMLSCAAALLTNEWMPWTRVSDPNTTGPCATSCDRLARSSRRYTASILSWITDWLCLARLTAFRALY